MNNVCIQIHFAFTLLLKFFFDNLLDKTNLVQLLNYHLETYESFHSQRRLYGPSEW